MRARKAGGPGTAPDQGGMLVSRDIKLLQRPRQVSLAVRRQSHGARNGENLMRYILFVLHFSIAFLVAMLANAPAQVNALPAQTKQPSGLFDFNQMWSGGKAEGKGRVPFSHAPRKQMGVTPTHSTFCCRGRLRDVPMAHVGGSVLRTDCKNPPMEGLIANRVSAHDREM
jgi:hypothetical protein